MFDAPLSVCMFVGRVGLTPKVINEFHEIWEAGYFLLHLSDTWQPFNKFTEQYYLKHMECRNLYLIVFTSCYPHMPIGKMWIYRLLFFVCLRVCTVTDFSAEDKASGVKFCTVVHRRHGQEIFHFGEFYCLHSQLQRVTRRDETPCRFTLDTCLQTLWLFKKSKSYRDWFVEQISNAVYY